MTYVGRTAGTIDVMGDIFSICHACHVNNTVIRMDGCERNQ